jgi:hypothetical protein
MSKKVTNHHSKREQRQLDSVVSEIFEIRVKQLHSKTTKRAITDARLTAMYLQKELLKLSHPVISRHFKKKSHATSINAHSTVMGLIETDAEFQNKVNRCIAAFQEYSTDKIKQRYNLHFLISNAGVRVSGPDKTIYIPASKQNALDGILKERINRLAKKHNYSLQLTID